MELDALLPQVLTSLFREIVDGPPGDMAFIVDPSDPSVAGHVQHLCVRRSGSRRGQVGENA